MKHKQQIELLKRALKSKGITYKKLAQMLEISEPTIGRMFSIGAFSLERYVEICQLIGLTYEDMIRLGESEPQVFEFTLEQERFFANNQIYLIFLLLMLRDRKSPQEIAGEYNLNEQTVSKILSRLDKMKLIEWLPGNKAKLLISTKYSPIENGPIRKAYGKELIMDFIEGTFEGENEYRRMEIVRFSQETLEKFMSKMQELAKEAVSEMDRDILLKRPGEYVSLLFALRPWNGYKERLRNIKL